MGTPAECNPTDRNTFAEFASTQKAAVVAQMKNCSGTSLQDDKAFKCVLDPFLSPTCVDCLILEGFVAGVGSNGTINIKGLGSGGALVNLNMSQVPAECLKGNVAGAGSALNVGAATVF